MNELIQLLKKIENGEIPVVTTVSQDFINIMSYAKEKPLNKDTVREYMDNQNLYNNEEDVDHFMRNLFTVHAFLQNDNDRKKLSGLVNNVAQIGGGVRPDPKIIKELINSGFRCYPVSYYNGFVLGIITKVGHVIIE